MPPVFDSVRDLYAPVVLGLGQLAAAAVLGMLVVVGLVARAARRRARRRAAITSIRATLREAA